jgi:dTDP-4-dehydrorhamnose reductase
VGTAVKLTSRAAAAVDGFACRQGNAGAHNPRRTRSLARRFNSAELDRIAPDLIINPAAYTAVDRAEEESDLAYQINSEAPGHIARWAAHHRVPLIHLSIDYVYDDSCARPWLENDVTAPLSVCGGSKLAGEAAIRAANAPHLIVCTSWVYAAKGINFLGTIARIASERPELRIVADQIGAPTSAQVIANAIAQIVTTYASNLPSGSPRPTGSCT